MDDKDKTIIGLAQLVSGLSREIQYLHAVIDNLPGSIYWKDTDGIYRGNNAFARQILCENSGITQSIIGKSDYDLFDFDRAEMFRDFDAKVIDTQQTLRAVEETYTQEGEKKTQLSIKKPLFNDQNKLIGVIGNTVDITEQKRIEEQLREARDKLEIANNIKNEFIGNMTHDIRTPLSAIQSLSEDILLHSDNKLMQNNAHYLMKSGQQLLNYFERIFEVLCLEKSKDKEAKTCFDLHASMQALFDIIMVSAKNKGINLTLEIADNVPRYVKSYDTYLQRIILNLLINAIKFTDQGGVTLSITVDSIDDDNIWLYFSVIDTGIGISDKIKDVIYDKFSRGTASYHGQYHGAGVGLYIVKKLVGEIGGIIELQSQLHKGTNFICHLPLGCVCENEIKSLLSEPLQHAPLSSQINQHEYQLNTEYDTNTVDVGDPDDDCDFNEASCVKILLIEDNKIAQYAEASKLKRLNCHIDMADNAGSALKLLENNNYHLVLCDVGLPDMHGFDLVQVIYRKFRKKYDKILLLTAHINREINHEIETIIDGIYMKPLLLDDASTIVTAIREDYDL